MEPVTLGVIAAGLIAKAVEKASDRAAEGAVDAAGSSMQKLLTWTRGRFVGRQELIEVEEVPDSPRRVLALGEVIDAELVEDLPARSELQAMIETIRSPGSTVNYIEHVEARENGIAFGHVEGGVHVGPGAGLGPTRGS